ncbi:MAG: thiamine pyrophosphate-dependent enzyme [Candidatus Helarchaeota archaeon]
MALMPTYKIEKPDHPYGKNTFTGKLAGHTFNLFCRGCGYGTIAHLFTRVWEDNGLDLNYPNIVGVGCYSMIPLVLPGQKNMALHGRGIAVATGMKLANPDLKPIVWEGDGDALAIGTNHFVHACRRNIDMVLFLLNNKTYGMTGGQMAPTTPEKYKATTAPYGMLEKPFDAVELAIAAGATYVARWTTAHPRQLMKSMKTAILEHKGFAVIDIVSQCVTYFGRKNKMAEPVQVFRWIKDHSITIKKAEGLSEEELKDKIIVGEFKNVKEPELSEKYIELIKKVRGL